MSTVTLTLIGGPTVLIEVAGLRLLTDPTFDPPGCYRLPHVTLTKTAGPALTDGQMGAIDAVLLSHDQHADNFDRLGRRLALAAPRLLTHAAAAARLGGAASGLAPWQTAALPRGVTVTATPARHGPAGIEPLAGEVVGFVIAAPETAAIYVTGDTVWFAGTAEVARRYAPGLVLPFAGAARTRGPFDLTMDANDVLEAASAFPGARLVPVHYEGWAHFTQGRAEIDAAFAALGLAARILWLAPGQPTSVSLAPAVR